MNPTAIILGSGTSNGVPTLGKTYPPGYLDEPKNWRTRSSCVLLGPEGNVLVDCAPEMRLQLLREGVEDVAATLITHTHADHIMGMDDLRAFCLKYQAPMPVYAAPEHQADIRRVFPYAFEEFPPGIFVPRFELHEPAATLHLGGLEIQTRYFPHGPVRCMGVRVGGFGYLTDLSEVPDDARPWLEGLDTLVLDAVRYRPHRNHLHFEKALEEADRIGAKMTYLTHLSDDYDHHRTEALLPPNIRLAYDGLRVPLEGSAEKT